MASNVQLSTNVGTGAVAATAQIAHDGDTAQLQLVGLMGIAGTEDAYTAAKIDGTAANGLDVDVTRVIPGTTATALGKAEDAAAASGDTGVLVLGVRRDTAASGADTDGDYATMNLDASGRVHVNVGTSALPSGAATSANQSTANTALAAIQTAVEVLDNAIAGSEMQVDVLTLPNVTLAAGTNTNEVVGDAAHDAAVSGNPLLMGGYASAAAPTAVSLDGDAVRAWFLLNGAQATVLTAAGALIGGDATNGLDVDVTRLPALAAGTNNIGDVDVLSIAAGDNNIGNVDIVTMPNVTLAAGTNTNEVVGDAAHGAAAAGNPLLQGLEGRSTAPTAVDDGDVVRALASLLGKQVSLPYAIPANTWSYAAASGGITNTTGVTALSAPGAGIRAYVTRAQIINGHATVSTDVQIRDGASGTVMFRAFAQAAGGGVTAVFDPPLRFTANTLVEIACGTTGSATYVNLQGYTAAE